MAEGRATTLLDFAIAASVAVVPVLLLVLLLVGVARPLDTVGQAARPVWYPDFRLSRA